MNETIVTIADSPDIKTRFHVHDLRFEVIFAEIRALLKKEGIEVILLKGPHLAHAYYKQPHERPYADLDILVKPKQFALAAATLAANRFTRIEENALNLATEARMNHWSYRSRFGQLIELHRGFTGQDRHPVDMDAWFSRSEEFTYGNTPTRGLAAEDLLCHLCLHIGKSFFYFIEGKHVRDLDVVIRKGKVDWHAFIARCGETRSKAISYYCLLAAKSQYGTPVPVEVLAALRPGKLRRKWLDKHLDVRSFPLYRFFSRGTDHARKRLTLPLLDGVLSWFPFLARTAWVRSMDVVLRIPGVAKYWKKVVSRQ